MTDTGGEILTHAEIFDDIYLTNFWGGSGGGSREEVAWPFAAYASRVIRKESIGTVLDIGCGRGAMSRMLTLYDDAGTTHYIGVDLSVEALADAKPDGLRSYRVMNAIADKLPPAGLLLLKEVTQHLSNADVRALLANLARYPMVLHCSALHGGVHLWTDGDIETGKGYRPVRLADFGCKNVTPVLEWQAFGGSYQMELWRQGA